MRQPAIELRGVRKAYPSGVAVDDLDLTVPAGVVYGLLGPNGAGKTTTIKMLLGLVQPSAGTIRVLGGSSADAAIRTQIGFLPEHFRFHDWLTAAEFLDFHGQLYGMTKEARARRIPLVLEQVGLASRRDSRLRSFSKGMLQRVGLAQALLNEPKLLILDEPTSGLDPGGRQEVRDLILDLRRGGGATVLLNSHILSEVERVCDEVAILDLGRLVWSGDPRRLPGSRLAVEAEVREPSGGLLAAVRAIAPDAQLDGEVLQCSAEDEATVAGIAAAIVGSGTRLVRLDPHQASLEELFLSLVKGRDA